MSPFARGDLDAVRVEEARGADGGLHRIAGELVLQHIDLVVEGHVQACHQVLGGDVLLHPVGAAVEAALAPAGQVEHGFPQRLRGDGAGVDRYAADAPTFLHHEDGAAELRRLDGGAAAGGATADDDEVVGVHGRRVREGRPACLPQLCDAAEGWKEFETRTDYFSFGQPGMAGGELVQTFDDRTLDCRCAGSRIGVCPGICGVGGRVAALRRQRDGRLYMGSLRGHDVGCASGWADGTPATPKDCALHLYWHAGLPVCRDGALQPR